MFSSSTNIEFISPPFTVPKLRFTLNTVAATQQPTLPMFAPTPNLELNSENEEGSDYDPFLGMCNNSFYIYCLNQILLTLLMYLEFLFLIYYNTQI